MMNDSVDLQEIRNAMQERYGRKYDLPYVTRENVLDATGGRFGHKTMSELDRKGRGPKYKFKIGRTIAYEVNDFFDWFQSIMKSE